jgi:glycosyltransferase involved in cell wall biosynthesis
LRERLVVDVLLPARDEERALPLVLAELPRALVRHVVVVDNGSSDRTAAVAERAGAVVVREPRPGYGSACLAGLAWIAARPVPPEVVVFLDADHSDHPDELPALLRPIEEDRAALVVGSRVLGRRERFALLPQARFGNWLASRLIRLRYGVRVTDLGPFRAIRWDALVSLRMADRDFGWTAEMQVKAARAGLPMVEVPVSYRRRIGASKITGTLSGSVRAGLKILATIARS